MANILQQLQDEQAMLLMYLADELPAEDRAAVERRLAGDARLVEELQKMRQTHEAFLAAMRRLDEIDGQPI
jgi:anti-sigma factor RsiW